MVTLVHFFQMDGYGKYVFSAYLSVMVFLFAQWFFSWRSWRRYACVQKKKYE